LEHDSITLCLPVASFDSLWLKKRLLNVRETTHGCSVPEISQKESNTSSGGKAPWYSEHFVRTEVLTYNPDLQLIYGARREGATVCSYLTEMVFIDWTGLGHPLLYHCYERGIPPRLCALPYNVLSRGGI
jgi:hypothetical protein